MFVGDCTNLLLINSATHDSVCRNERDGIKGNCYGEDQGKPTATRSGVPKNTYLKYSKYSF